MNTLNWEFLIGPIVGGVIGYITNGIAIKMLFRPLKPVYLLGMKLPFTPGLIPKEKGRLARSIGQVVGRELINEEVLARVLLQDNIYANINQKIDEIIESLSANEQTLKEICDELLGDEVAEQLIRRAEDSLTHKVYTKVTEIDLGRVAVENLVKEIKNGFDKSMFGAFAFFINDSLIESIASKLEPMINKMIADEGEALIANAIRTESEAFLETSVMNTAEKIKDYADIIKSIVKKSYTYFVQHNLSHALELIDLSKVVEERINAFDTLELEKLILEIMSKELNAIIWLGALLGAILGCITSII
ncbi:MAG: hypothetical protein K0S71_1131 [Clostridia bacterium]|jgi:uncharacterized membrane protein YheB (UPF0754 family)|nr:hypothetical protein [Clostridia bacterium]